MKHIELKAYWYGDKTLQGFTELAAESSIPQYLPLLAARAGLGAEAAEQPIYSGRFNYENGYIQASKVIDRDCTLEGMKSNV